MRTKLPMVILPILLAATGVILGQSKPIEQMSPTEQRAFFRHQQHEVLRNLPALGVFTIYDGATNNESERLQSVIELRLRTNGVPVLSMTSDEHRRSAGQPMLLCSVSHIARGPVLVAKIKVQLFEELRSVRTGSIHVLPTWENVIGAEQVVEKPSIERAREWLLEAVDEFANAYLSMNPKNP